MLEVKVWDIPHGSRTLVVAYVGSVQMTGDSLRDENGNTLLYYNHITSKWVVYADGSEWFDFTVGFPS